MKKLMLITAMAFLAFAMHKSANAQVIKVGGGAELRTSPPAAFIVKATYNLGVLDESLGTSVDFMLIPDLETNLDIHYAFLNDFGIKAYGLGGVNYFGNFGVNIGTGVNYNISDALDAFGEVKYIIKNDPEASIKIGVLYYL